MPYQTTTYAATYDPEDRLTVAVQGILNAGYDGDGLRAWSSDGPASPVTGDNTYYLYDGSQSVVEEAYTGEDLFYSLFGATGLEGRNKAYAGANGDPTQIAYSAYTYDPQGNLVQPVTLYPESRQTGGPYVSVDTSSAYDGFGWGSPFEAEGQVDYYSPVGFGGQQGYYKDYTGLYLLTHRYFDAGAGRFVTRDPIGYGGGINLYGFAGNNPVNESDPNGTSVAGEVIIWLVKMAERDGVRYKQYVRPVSMKVAQVLRQKGANIEVQSQNARLARRVAKKIEDQVPGRTIEHGPHDDPDIARPRPHYQTNGMRGHTFYNALSIATLFLPPMLQVEERSPEELAWRDKQAKQSILGRWLDRQILRLGGHK